MSHWLRDQLPDWISDWFWTSHDVSKVKLKLADEEARGAATGAVMAHVLSRPDSIRQRAQAAATISGALGVALVVAAVTGLTDEGESFKDWTVRLVCGGIVLFAISTWLSVYAVVFPHRRSGLRDYRQLVKDYEDYADEVRQKMRWAATATVGALVLTAGAVVAEIAERVAREDSKRMALVLSPQAMSAVEKLCSDSRKMADHRKGAPQDRKMERLVTADLPEDRPLGKDIVELENVKLENEQCDKGTVTLPRKSIRAAQATVLRRPLAR